MDRAAGQVQVVSTAAVPLWPNVKAGAFNETLYYRLNTVCVNVDVEQQFAWRHPTRPW